MTRMPYEVYQGNKLVARRRTEEEALEAVRQHCHVEGVPDASSISAMSMVLVKVDSLGRPRHRWWGAQIAARMDDPSE